VVTGAASGLGRVIASQLLTERRPVILVDRDAEALSATGARLDARHAASVSLVVADLSSVPGIRAAADELTARPDLAALVNNAGGWLPGDQYPEAPPDRWLSALTLNLIAPMLLTQLLWPRLAAAGGAVVNIGSSGGIGDDAYGSPEYGAAKAGLHRFTSSLSSRNEVPVTTVVPGWVGLERAQREWAALPAAEQQRLGPLIPPEDVAGIVVDLLTGGRPGEVVYALHEPGSVSSRSSGVTAGRPGRRAPATPGRPTVSRRLAGRVRGSAPLRRRRSG
jgi:NAD(P)-dependent dehydrogenase (short-subunit alcohol dehydrogenase family)